MSLKEVKIYMDELSQSLMAELNCETVFTIPIFGGIPILESVVVTWIIMAVVILLCIIFVRNFRVENPGKRQLAIESAVTWLKSFITDMLGADAAGYSEYICSIVIYIAVANIIGIFGYKPPTKDLNVTAGLALMSIIAIEYAGIHR